MFGDVQTIVIADWANHCIVQCEKGARNGQVVAGGNGKRNISNQLNLPTSVLFDKDTDSFIISDWANHRILRWPQGAQQGAVITGGNNKGSEANQLNDPIGLCFDLQGNLYVSDRFNHRVQRFSIE